MQGAAVSPGTNDPVQRRGWFYRALAPDPDSEVFAVGAPFMRRWLPSVTLGTFADTLRSPPQRPFSMVIVHGTLGGCPSLIDAFKSAATLLAESGIVVLSGYNRLRERKDRSASEAFPRATAWGYRRAARRAGFRDVELFVARPALDDFTIAFSTAYACARAFYRLELASRRGAGRLRWSRVRSCLATCGIASSIEPVFVVVAKRC